MIFFNSENKRLKDITFTDFVIDYTYSSFLEIENINLNGLAFEVVNSGLSQCVVDSEGIIIYKTNKKIKKACIKFENDKISTNVKFYNEDNKLINFDNNKEIMNNCVEASGEIFSRKKLFVSDFVNKYVKIYLDDFLLETNGYQYLINPSMLIFEDGVVIIKYKLIVEGFFVKTFDFIENYVNLSLKDFKKIKVSPAFCKIAASSYERSVKRTLFNRYQLIKDEKNHYKEVDRLKEVIKWGDGEIELIDLPRLEDEEENFSSLVQTTLNMINYLINKPNNFNYLILGKIYQIKNGDFWSGRPYIYLFNFIGKKKSSIYNEKFFKNEFLSILSRTPYKISNKKLNLRNLRFFNDCSVYISSSACLLVTSSLSDENNTNQSYIKDYENVVNFLEYGYMVNRTLLNKINNTKEWQRIFELRKKFNEISSLEEISYVGEIREQLKFGWNEFGIERIKLKINNAIQINHDEINYNYTIDTNKRNLIFVILFGILTIPSIGKEVIKPIWEKYLLYSPIDKTFDGLFFSVLTLFIIFSIFIPIYLYTMWKRK